MSLSTRELTLDTTEDEIRRGAHSWSLATIIRALGRLSREDASALERQIPFTALFCIGLLFIPFGFLELIKPALLYWSMALVALQVVLAATLPWQRWPDSAVMVMSILQFGAVILLALATPRVGNPVNTLVFVPAVSLGLLRGRTGVWVGGLCTLIAGFVPYAVDGSGAFGALTVMRTLFLPLVAVTLALTVNEVTRRLRRRTEAVVALRLSQNALLARAHSDALELERSAEAMRAVQDVWSSVIDATTEQAIIGTDAEGVIELFNPGAVKLLGRSREEALGHNIVEFYLASELADRGAEPDARLRALFGMVVARARAGVPDARDWTYVRANGEHTTVRIVATERALLGGVPGGFTFVATDVTQERESARLKDEFVSMVSHELRTPISSVLGYLELLRESEDELTQEQSGYLAVVERNARRLLRLVGDLLLAAQVDAGRFSVSHEPVDLADVVSKSVEGARPIARDSGVTLEETESGSFTVSGDASRLGQALDNLISNAIKFTPRGGEVQVVVRSEPTASGVAGVAVAVADSGIGIPPEELDQLFTRFFRASSATRRAIPGVGLGLTVTKAIVEAHDGDLSVSSSPGEGTTFTLRLPLR